MVKIGEWRDAGKAKSIVVVAMRQDECHDVVLWTLKW